jgi:hypothetical protein
MKDNNFKITEYADHIHAEVTEDLQTGDYGYKFRILDNVVMPPYITPSRYHLSRTIKTRSGDICYVSFPKSGSTWLAHIILLITLNGETPTDKPLRDCLHWVASSWTYPRSKSEIEALPSPRIFKSHMPYHMALGGNPAECPCKYIYIARNPKDVAVSYYYFERDKSWAGNYNGPWEHWLNMFIEGRVQRGDWFDHILSWWNHRKEENLLFLRYEDLRRNFDRELRKIARFLDYPLSIEAVNKITEKTVFNNMKKDDFSNMHEIKEFQGFFRKGEIGSWKDQFTVIQNEEFDKLYARRIQSSGLHFEFE